MARALQERTSRVYKPRAVNEEKETEWRRVFERFRRSELPFKKFCARENISPNTFQYWRRQLRTRDEARGVSSTICKGDNRPSNLQQNINYWLGIISEINAHEGSVRSYCRSRGIASGSLHAWEKRLREMNLTNGIQKGTREQTPSPRFVPVQILDDHPREQQSKTVDDLLKHIEIKRTDGVVISLPASTSASFIIQLIGGTKT
jgi:transposase-like protein